MNPDMPANAEKTIHIVANSHNDPVWLWDKYEGIDEVLNTFKAACDRLDETPSLKFTMSSICFLKWTWQFAPEVFARIQAHVAAGRWEVAGGWWVETDCNLPTSRSFYKSAELSRAFLDRHFPGLAVPVAYSPDSFGHAASLPTILARGGFKYYVICRPGEHEKADLPGNLFYWEHEGSRMLCYRLKYHYCSSLGDSARRADVALADEELVRRGLGCFFFGVGDHGGGPAKQEIEYLLKKQAETTGRRLLFSTCREFFEAAEQLDDIPVYAGDLHYHAVGCYSVNRPLKAAIRASERALEYTERVSRLAGQTADLDPLWEKTIFNQFHDIMPGSCAPEAARQALGELGGVLEAAENQAYAALKSLSRVRPVQCREGEFRIVNSLPEPVTAPLEIESWMYYPDGAPFMDDTGRVLPIQEITPSVICMNRRWLFVDTIPAESEKVYYFDTTVTPQPAPPVRFDPGETIAAGRFRVESPGQIWCDGAPLFTAPLALGVIPDASDTWSHGVRGFGAATAWFQPVASTVSRGPLASRLFVRLAHHHSQAELLFTAYEHLPYLDLEVLVRWAEERSILKLELAPAGGIPSLTVQGPGASIAKDTTGAEEPLHGWLQAGPLALVQDGAFAFDRVGDLPAADGHLAGDPKTDNPEAGDRRMAGDRLRLTLVRSSYYAFHDPFPPDPHAPHHHTDQGEHRFRLRLFHQEDLTLSRLDRLTAAFIEPFRVLRSNL